MCHKETQNADVVKLADTPDLGSGAVRCAGSSPVIRIVKNPGLVRTGIFFINTKICEGEINVAEYFFGKLDDVVYNTSL